MKLCFLEGELELRSGDCLVRNYDNVLIATWRYDELMPFLDEYRADFRLRNFLAVTTALLIWIPALAALFFFAKQGLLPGGIIAAIIPGCIGYYFFRLRKKSFVKYVLSIFSTGESWELTLPYRTEESEKFIAEFRAHLKERSNVLRHMEEGADHANPKWIREFQELHHLGILSDEEFQAEKQRFLETAKQKYS